MASIKPHVSLNVTNLQASIEFYQKLFGVDPVRVREDYAKFDLEHPGLNLALNSRPYTKGTGTLSHLGVQVDSTEEVMTVRTRLQESGLLTKDEFQTDCCYALQDKIWVSDPDGNGWEFFVVLDNSNDTVSPSESGCCTANMKTESVKASACC
jgi:catechol 2,3-dioxygenase-like lactoylglutathione lyase family enzyme